MDTWNSSDLNDMLTKVFNRLKVVLCNILRGQGGNDKVEEYRGVKHSKVKIENVIRDLEKDGELLGEDLHLDYNHINLIENEDELTFENEEI